MSDTAYQYAHYDQDISSGLIAGSSVLIAAMVAATGLRMVSQMKTWGKLGLDDYLLLVGLPINIALCVFNIESTFIPNICAKNEFEMLTCPSGQTWAWKTPSPGQ